MKKLLLFIGLVSSISCFADQLPTTIPEIQPKPVVSIYTPQSFDETTKDSWYAFSNALLTLEKGTHIKLLVSGYGGDALIVEEVASAINKAQQNGVIVDVEVIGEAISGHAALLCAGTALAINDGASVTFHNEGGVSSYLFGMIQYRSHNTDPADLAPYYTLLSQCVVKHYLTYNQFKDIQNGKRVVLIALNGRILSYTIDDYADNPLDLLTQFAYFVVCFCGLLLTVAVIKRI